MLCECLMGLMERLIVQTAIDKGWEKTWRLRILWYTLYLSLMAPKEHAFGKETSCWTKMSRFEADNRRPVGAGSTTSILARFNCTKHLFISLLNLKSQVGKKGSTYCEPSVLKWGFDLNHSFSSLMGRLFIFFITTISRSIAKELIISAGAVITTAVLGVAVGFSRYTVYKYTFHIISILTWKTNKTKRADLHSSTVYSRQRKYCRRGACTTG